MAESPSENDGLIVLKEPYTSLVLTGEKDMELRCRPIKRDYYLADSTTHMVLAFVEFGESVELDQDAYDANVSRHRCTRLTKPYKRTVGTIVKSVKRLDRPVPYRAKKGAIGFCRYTSSLTSDR